MINDNKIVKRSKYAVLSLPSSRNDKGYTRKSLKNQTVTWMAKMLTSCQKCVFYCSWQLFYRKNAAQKPV